MDRWLDECIDFTPTISGWVTASWVYSFVVKLNWGSDCMGDCWSVYFCSQLNWRSDLVEWSCKLSGWSVLVRVTIWSNCKLDGCPDFWWLLVGWLLVWPLTSIFCGVFLLFFLPFSWGGQVNVLPFWQGGSNIANLVYSSFSALVGVQHIVSLFVFLVSIGEGSVLQSMFTLFKMVLVSISISWGCHLGFIIKLVLCLFWAGAYCDMGGGVFNILP